MKIPFKIYYPGGNTTALVLKKMPKAGYAKVAKNLMYANKTIEQVGFIEPAKKPGTDLHLQMMGGEFCGSAARCAALYASKVFKKNKVILTVSGYPEILEAKINKNIVSLKLPGSFLLGVNKINSNFIVDLSGIRFFISKKQIKKNQLKPIIKKYGKNWLAVGVQQLVNAKGGFKIFPWVWVKETKSIIKETGCTSGSLAAAVTLSFKSPFKKLFRIVQPSGEAYSVKVLGVNKKIKSFVITGKVKELP